VPGAIDLTASCDRMRLRFVEGLLATVHADLALRGTFAAPVLAGTINVEDAVYTRRVDFGGGLFELAGAGSADTAAAEAAALPVRFDLRLIAPSTLRVRNNLAQIVASADLTLGGTLDRPLLFGNAEIERGEVIFEGRRYIVNRGTVDFTNPSRIEPFFDVQAETRVRVPGETYRVVLDAVGTRSRLNWGLTSDPPLPQIDVVALLIGDVRSTQDAELRALRQPNTVETELLQARLARALGGPISSEVGRVVERTFGVDTFQLTPSLIDPYQQSSQLSVGARLTIGKRLSNRTYITYSRSLTSPNQDELILLEYDQTDRLSWILSRNEDKTYALDVRVRHIF
jgi:translocation and assembly module TamB